MTRRRVDPDDFAVPVAIDGDGRAHQVRDGRPAAPWLGCAICRARVVFVSETEARAAHFRHVRRADCDRLVAHHRDTLHNGLRDAAAKLLNGSRPARDLVRGASADLPSGEAVVERVAPGGYRPDVTVLPAEGERAPRLELEVVHHHAPEPARIAAAAEAGALVAVLDARRAERDYFAKLHAGEVPDYEAAVAALGFHIMSRSRQRRIVAGVADREYLAARGAAGRCEHAPAASPPIRRRLSSAPSHAPAPVPPPPPPPPPPTPAPTVDDPSARWAAALERIAARRDLTPHGRFKHILEVAPELGPLAERARRIGDVDMLAAIERGEPPARRQLRPHERVVVRAWREVLEEPPF